MNQRLWPRIVALAVVVVAGVYYIANDVMRYRLGNQGFTVSAVMPSAGGLYQGADVTYRGVDVGTVTSLQVHPTDVVVRMNLNPGTRIPNNGVAQVHDLSALGEQYLDFQPSRASGPYLHGGSVIPANRIQLPVPIGAALIDLGSLLNSVNPQDLRTVESFFYSAFDGTGPGLKNIITTGQSLFQALVAAQPETVNLIDDGQTDLTTLKNTDSDLTTFSQGLASLTAQLAASNNDVKGLIDNGAAASQQLNQFLQQHQSALAGAIDNLSTDSAATNVYQPAVQALFEVLPVVAGNLAQSASNGQVRGELTFNTQDPVCSYVSAPGVPAAYPAPDQPVSSAPLGNYCPTRSSNLLQRGSYNAPGGS